MEFKIVTKRVSKDARNFMHNLTNYLHNDLKNKYKFDIRLVGSVRWNTALLIEGVYDLDYQILLTKKSKEYKKNNNIDANQVHRDFKSSLDRYFNSKSIKGKVMESTSAFTLEFNDRNYSIDIVLIRYYPDNNEIVRRKNNDSETINDYSWNQLKEFNKAYDIFRNLSNAEKEDLIKNYILPKKFEQKKKGENATKTSSQIFIEEVNNYVKRNRNRL